MLSNVTCMHTWQKSMALFISSNLTELWMNFKKKVLLWSGRIQSSPFLCMSIFCHRHVGLFLTSWSGTQVYFRNSDINCQDWGSTWSGKRADVNAYTDWNITLTENVIIPHCLCDNLCEKDATILHTLCFTGYPQHKVM